MNTSDCSLPAPKIYRVIMVASHFISFPIYAAALYVLFRHHAKSFQTYKYYLIGHTVLNILCEVYMSFFYLPMTYLPYPAIRSTGILADWNFSGLFQWYILATFVMLTGASIIEMFYYRFKVSIIDADQHKFMRILKFGIYGFRFFIVVHTIFAFATFNYIIEMQAIAKEEFLSKTPGAAPEIGCYTSIYALVYSWTQQSTVVMYTLLLMIAVVITPSSVYFIMRFLMSCNLSSSTIKMQKMFIISLTFQALVHGGMIAAPVVGAVMGIFSLLPFDESSYILLLILNFHGFCSTCTMILFTKPLRDKFSNTLCRTNTTTMISPSKTVSVVIESRAPVSPNRRFTPPGKNVL